MITSRRAARREGALAAADLTAERKTVNELDAEWENRLRQAEERARGAGRRDVAQYLSLRAVNDTARAVGVEWLLESFTVLAGEANRAGGGLSLARAEAHRFRAGNSTMVGTQLTLRAGVRALTVEAGWPRAPQDGIVRGGGLASARISHFGDRAAGEDLLLVREADGAPRWLVLEATGARTALFAERMRRHLTKLLAVR